MFEVSAQKLFTTGLDEAGRGALAGPVVAAAVCWPEGVTLPGLADSKKLTAKQREALFIEITSKALSWSYTALPASHVDKVNILQASLEAMRLSYAALPQEHQCHGIADGPIRPAQDIAALVKGDSLVPAISAASIVAKVIRDRMMQSYDLLYPGYDLSKHKGYPTASHTLALKTKGVSSLHRRSYAPVAECL